MANNDDSCAGQKSGMKKWCKASWYRKGHTGKVESDAIPRTWVSRSLGVVKWPPPNVNFKYAIENCTGPKTDENWSQYKLRSCSQSFLSLAEARQVATDVEAMEEMQSDSGDDGGNVVDSDPGELGRGRRPKVKAKTLSGFESGTDNWDDGGSDGVTAPVARLTPPAVRVTASVEKNQETIPKQLSSLPTKKTMPPKPPAKPTTSSTSPTAPAFKKSSDSTVNDESPPSQETAIEEIKFLVANLAAQEKVRHEELSEKLDKQDHDLKKLRKMVYTLKQKLGGDNEGENADVAEIPSDEDEDLESRFSVRLPVQNFEEFEQLEEELRSSTQKRRHLVGKDFCDNFPKLSHDILSPPTGR